MSALRPVLKYGKPPAPENQRTSSHDDRLGSYLQGKWTDWANARRFQELDWLRDERTFNKVNEPDIESPAVVSSHKHIYFGQTHTKCSIAFARIIKPIFGKDKHWEIKPTPIPEMDLQFDDYQQLLEEAQKRAEGMATEIADYLIPLEYEKHLKTAILEATVIGTGCVKGVFVGVKKKSSWQPVNGEWKKVQNDMITPLMASPSVWNLYIPPNAIHVSDMDGIFERHILNRAQFAALKLDSRFDSEKIDEFLETSRRGNYTQLYHEIERRQINGTGNNSVLVNDEYEILEYTGIVSGFDLADAGYVGVEDVKNYWCNVWFYNGKTIHIRHSLYTGQTIPYHFFKYAETLYQFWGRSPAWNNRASQYSYNGVARAALDNAAWAAHPLREVNTSMLKDGQDPRIVYPGQTFLRDKGDPSNPAIRFWQPDDHTGQLMNMAKEFENTASDESMIPKFSYSGSQDEINQTKGGLQMQLDVASLPTELVIKNLEDGVIKPFIKSVFDFIMQWSDKEEIKGDMDVEVLISSVLLAKTARTQQLIQYSSIVANNPKMAEKTDFDYLNKEIAKSLDIDPAKAIPDKLPEQPPQQPIPDSALDQAHAELYKIQALKEQKLAEKAEAEKTAVNIKSQYEAIQTGIAVLNNPTVVPVADQLMLSGGYKDANGAPLTTAPEQAQAIPQQQNTSPQYPPTTPAPEQMQMPEPQPITPTAPSPAAGIGAGIETIRADGGQVQ
jgi:hypothetical protein